jgi:hypothetical protein
MHVIFCKKHQKYFMFLNIFFAKNLNISPFNLLLYLKFIY